jgi:SAM-dependent methyltransferase
MKSIPFDRAADYYDATRGFPPGVADRVADSIATILPPRAEVLEVGIGTGRIAKPLLARGLRVTGVDLSPRMMQRLTETLPAGVPPPGLILGDAAELPLAAGVFAAVVSVHVFHLIAGWQAALTEARRVLKTGGVFLLGYDWRPDDSPSEGLRRQWKKIAERSGLTINQPGVRDFSDVRAELERSGARVSEWSVGEWHSSSTLADQLESIERRSWSSTWDIPDELFAGSLAELRSQAIREYGSLDREFTTPHKFVWQRYQW